MLKNIRIINNNNAENKFFNPHHNIASTSTSNYNSKSKINCLFKQIFEMKNLLLCKIFKNGA